MDAANDPVLVRLRQALDAVYGNRLDRVVLFGSRARGDAKPHSDYDIAVFLKDPGELWDELGQLAHIRTEILDDTGAVISAKPFPASAYLERSPLMHEYATTGLSCDARGRAVSRKARQCLALTKPFRNFWAVPMS